jgi:hypothetical protein
VAYHLCEAADAWRRFCGNAVWRVGTLSAVLVSVRVWVLRQLDNFAPIPQQQLNEIMKVLTVFAAVFSPFIAEIYGTPRALDRGPDCAPTIREADTKSLPVILLLGRSRRTSR